jgi:outer membrane protein
MQNPKLLSKKITRPEIMKHYKILLAVFTLSAASYTSAADLMSIYALAERHDTQIRFATANYHANRQVVPQNRAALLPQLSASLYASESDSDVADPMDVTNSTETETHGNSINLRQSIYNHGHWQRLKQANASAAQAEADYNAARQELILRVAQAYFTVLAAIDNLEFAEAEKTSVGQQLEQAKQRFEVGLIAITDVKESQALYDQAVASEIQAANALSASREALWGLTNHYPDTLKTLGENLPLLTPDPEDKQQWVDKSLNENLSLLAAQFGRVAAERNVGAQRSGHYPSLDLNANRNFSETEGSNFPLQERTRTEVGITLSIPIYEGGIVSARTKEAVFRRDAARENEEAVRRQVVQQARNAYQNVIADISRVKALQQALVSSQAAYEATVAGFEVGTRNSVEVLVSLRNTFAAQRDYAQTRYDYLLDTLRLKQAAGNLSVADLQAINRWLQ